MCIRDRSNDEIIKQYPFLFELNVTYKLLENTLTCFINVKNKDHQKMCIRDRMITTSKRETSLWGLNQLLID